MAKIITVAKARRIAGEWHDGQASALYAFSSSGTVIGGFLGEVRRFCKEAEEQRAKGDLWTEAYLDAQDFLAFAEWHADAGWSELTVE